MMCRSLSMDMRERKRVKVAASRRRFQWSAATCTANHPARLGYRYRYRTVPTSRFSRRFAFGTSCFRIKEVLGVSMCLKLSKTEKRLGYDYGDEDICYQVRGKYGGSKHEDPGPEPMWP